MTKKKTDVIEQPSTSIAQINAEGLLAQAIDKGVPVETMERLLAMRRELKAEWAKEQYDQAMAAFQADCPTIHKTKEVKTSGGQVAYKYAPIESIVEQVKGPLRDHGFSYTSAMELSEDGTKVAVQVKVTHKDGHSEVTEMTVPLGTKTNVMSQSQVVAAAQTFAKRYAFCNAFGIMTGDEDIDGHTDSVRKPEPAKAPVAPVKPEEPELITHEQMEKVDDLLDKIEGDLESLENKFGPISGWTKAFTDGLIIKLEAKAVEKEKTEVVQPHPDDNGEIDLSKLPF